MSDSSEPVLLSRLVSTPPRESSGARAQNRFDYQLCWALCRMLTIHAEGKDYRIVFDFHEDVLELNASTDPTQVVFIQVKSKDGGPHSRNDLLVRRKAKKGPGSSMLGRLFGSARPFFRDATALLLVSNCGCNLKRADKTPCLAHEVVSYKDLSDDDKTAISTALSSELAVLPADLPLALLTFERSPISLAEPHVHAKGRVEEFLSRTLPHTLVRPAALFNALHGEIQRRSASETIPTTVASLCEQRSICRADLQQMLKDLGAYVPFDQIVEHIRADLVNQGVPPLDAQRHHAACRSYVTLRVSEETQVLTAARASLRERFLALRAAGPPTPVLDTARRCLDSPDDSLRELAATSPAELPIGMALVVIYETQSEGLQAPNPKSAEEAS